MTQDEIERNSCKNAATWVIHTGQKPDDWTDTCTTHVGEMLIRGRNEVLPAENVGGMLLHWRATMKRIAILILSLAFAACASFQQAHTDLTTLHASFESLIAGKIGAGELTTNDLQNAKSRFEEHLSATGNPYDKVGVQCTTQLLAYFPTLQATFGPATPTPPTAPVTGFFSLIAAEQIATEDAQSRIAAKEALIRNGFPAEVTIACSPLRDVIGRALSHGGAK